MEPTSSAVANVAPYCYHQSKNGHVCIMNAGHFGDHSSGSFTWKQDDAVNHPPHYASSPAGIEAIDVTEHFNFNMGNAIKYIWRADLKGKPIEDLKKAAWYIEREIERRSKTK